MRKFVVLCRFYVDFVPVAEQMAYADPYAKWFHLWKLEDSEMAVDCLSAPS